MKKITVIIGTVFLLLFGFYLSFPVILNQMAKYLIVQDKIEKADVILVLGGDSDGERVAEGVNLFKRGYAKCLLMSGERRENARWNWL